MKGSLKFQALRQIFGELPNEEKRECLEHLVNSFVRSDLYILSEKIEQREKQIASIAETHLRRFDSNYSVSLGLSISLPKLGLTYYRNFGFHSQGTASKEEQDEFCRICRDFYDNKEYLWNQ